MLNSLKYPDISIIHRKIHDSINHNAAKFDNKLIETLSKVSSVIISTKISLKLSYIDKACFHPAFS